MAKYEVRRSFPSFRRGEVVVDPEWKNLEKLVRTGYLTEIVEDKPKEVAEIVGKAKKSEKKK